MKRYIALAILILLPLSVQAQPQIPEFEFKEVKGKYVNEALGIEITLPNGWSGIEFPSLPLLIGIEGGFVASPHGIDMAGSFSSTSPMMMLQVMDVKKMEEVEVGPPRSPTEPSKPHMREPDCRVLSFNLVEVSGAKGFEGVVECTVEDENGNPIQVRIKGLHVSQEKADSEQ